MPVTKQTILRDLRDSIVDIIENPTPHIASEYRSQGVLFSARKKNNAHNK